MELPEEDQPEGAPDWLMTFSDLVSLLVTLFIMMLTFTTQETDDLVEVMAMVKGSFGVHMVKPKPNMLPPETTENQRRHGVTEQDTEADMDKDLKVNELLGHVISDEELDRGTRIVPEILAAFGPGDFKPSVELETEMRRLARALRKHEERVFRIEGHCDRRSDHENPFGSLSLLGLERARQIAVILGREGVQLDRVIISSCAADKPRTRGFNDIEQAKNRRVEVVILPLGSN